MELGMIGLGRMGMNMVRRLIGGGHRVVVYNRTQDKVSRIVKEGAVGSQSVEDLVAKLNAPRVIWMMLPIGGPIDEHIEILTPLLSEGDILIDGGNSHFKDDLRREKTLKPKGILYMDAGVSGGIWDSRLATARWLGVLRRTSGTSNRY